MEQTYPILEFDPDPTAMIDPHSQRQPPAPARIVLCFFKDVIDHFLEQGYVQKLWSANSEMGEHPLYLFNAAFWQRASHVSHRHPEPDQPIGLFHQGVGAPLAGGLLDELIGNGGRKFIACGGCGVLDRAIAVGHLLVPTAAIRDEGLSYHYLPPSREAYPDADALAAIERVLQRHHIEYLLTKTWTTDAIFRETRGKVARRKAEGCLAVEMEASAMFAVAQFRGVQIAQILYGGDNLDGDEWDGRDWNNRWGVREKLIALAAEACLEL